MNAMAKISGVLNGPVQLIAGDQILKDIDRNLNQVAEYALLLRDETCYLPKVLIWDGGSYEAARCVRPYTGQRNSLVNLLEPSIQPHYNDIGAGSEIWSTRHTPQGCDPGGIYEVRSLFGGLIAHNACLLTNYPMYFEPGYRGTLWDYWHWIKDPRRNPSLNQNWTVKIDLCCEDLKRLNLFGDGQNTRLGAKVFVPSQYYQEGRLKEIEVSYNGSDNLGRHITLRGIV